MTTDPARPLRRIACGLAGSFAVLAVALYPGTAAAHGEEGLDDTDYRVTVTHTPDLDGVRLRSVEAGARLELTNTGDQPVELLGYSGEPYAELRPDGLYLNTNSPAAYLNVSADNGAEVPAQATPAASPAWTKASEVPAIRWHDHRAHWMDATAPPVVAADPRHDHRVLDWTIPLRVGTTVYAATGTLDWVAPPATSAWLAGALLLAAATAAAVVLASSRGKAAIGPALAAGIAGAAALIDAIGRSIVAADLEYSWPQALALHQIWPVVAALSAIAAAGYALAGKPAADLALGLAGVFTALMAGLTRFTSLNHAITATPWGGGFGRTTAILALGIGAGLAIGAAWQARGRTLTAR